MSSSTTELLAEARSYLDTRSYDSTERATFRAVVDEFDRTLVLLDQHSTALVNTSDHLAQLRAEIINTPETADFMAGVPLEAAHQRERWPSGHDAGKAPEDWLFLVGYLAGKACAAARTRNTDKALHHTISTAAVLANWHAALSGADTSMRPGIAPPEVAA